MMKNGAFSLGEQKLTAALSWTWVFYTAALVQIKIIPL